MGPRGRYPIIFSILLFITAVTARGTECLGPENPRACLVYLHGIDSEPPGDLERGNRIVLQHIATALGIRIALPRSPQKCPDGKNLCWNPNDGSKAGARRLLKTSMRLSAPCFPAGAPVHLLGFSSGGYLANKILRFCIDSGFASVTSVSGSGATGKFDPVDLHSCGALRMILNKEETEYPQAQVFAQKLQARGGNVRTNTYSGTRDEPWETYEGLHRLPYQPTLSVLKEQLFHSPAEATPENDPERSTR